jgi:opacity protein-like surface antigen
MPRLLRLLAAGIAGALLATSAARADGAVEQAAVAAAEAWLKQVDAGQYGASWDGAAKLFKGSVTRAQWEQALGGVRAPLGKVLSRKLSSRTYTESLPGAPDGKYVVLQYTTRFEGKQSAVETVTPMLDPDGRWRVSGYFVR